MLRVATSLTASVLSSSQPIHSPRPFATTSGAPLLGQGSELKDVSAHPAFQGDGRPGTFGNGTKSDKFDYILLSPELFAKVTQAGVFRKGVWGGKNGTLFEHYDTITKAEEAASDHAAIWVDVDV